MSVAYQDPTRRAIVPVAQRRACTSFSFCAKGHSRLHVGVTHLEPGCSGAKRVSRRPNLPSATLEVRSQKFEVPSFGPRSGRLTDHGRFPHFELPRALWLPIRSAGLI